MSQERHERGLWHIVIAEFDSPDARGVGGEKGDCRLLGCNVGKYCADRASTGMPEHLAVILSQDGYYHPVPMGTVVAQEALKDMKVAMVCEAEPSWLSVCNQTHDEVLRQYGLCPLRGAKANAGCRGSAASSPEKC